MAGEASFCCVPMLPFVGHLSLIYAYGFSASVAVLRKTAVETGQAVGSGFPHNIPLTAELSGAFSARKMLHVPGSTFSFCALVCEDYL